MRGIILLLSALLTVPAVAADLRIHVTGFEDSEGRMRLALFSERSRDAFPLKAEAAERVREAVIEGDEVRLNLRGVEPGRYALFVYHDRNQNGLIDHKWYGPPGESIAYFRPYRPIFRPPDFEQVAFDVHESDKVFDIELIHF